MSDRDMWAVRLGLVTVLMLVIAGMSFGEVPGRINYQGKLADSGTGEPLSGSHGMVFRLYDDPSDGSLLWSESQSVSVDSAGIFSTILGSDTPIEVAFDGPVWLEIEVGGEILSPRRELASVPYAFYADDAYMLDSLHADAFADTAHQHDDRYYTQDSLNTAGTLNDDSNPVDWTRLKNVPAGFADGTDDAGGAGDGHSLDSPSGFHIDAVYVDNNADVGIGTTNPATKLYIYENANAQIGITIENPNTGSSSAERIDFKDENGTLAAILANDPDHPTHPNALRMFNNRSGGTIEFATSGGLYSDLVLNDIGRVGIRTDSPQEALDVDGTVRITGFKLPTGATADYVLTSDATGTGTWQAAAVGDGHSLDAADGNPVDAIYVNTSGDVGVGTTSPNYNLHLHDPGVMKSCYLQLTNQTTGQTSTDGMRIGTDENGNSCLMNRDSSYLFLGTDDRIRFTITSDGDYGLGTVVPQTHLHIHEGDPGEPNHMHFTVDATGANHDDGMNIGISSSGGANFWNHEDTDMKFATNGTERMRITAGGDVGIGETTPEVRLELSGVQRIMGPPSWPTTGEGMEFGYNSGIDRGYIQVYDRVGGSWGQLYLGAGSVGIGEMDPAEMLEIKGSDPFIGLNTTNTKTGLKLQKNGMTEWEMAWNEGSGYLYFHNAGTRMVIEDATGDVGIGTSAPGYKLDVAGEAHASGFPTSSDARFKENVEQLTGVLDRLERVRGVTFDWNSRYESLGRATGHREIGVIAQEVEEVFPELVTTWGEDDYRAVDYGRMAGVFIESIKELRAENEALRLRIEALEQAID